MIVPLLAAWLPLAVGAPAQVSAEPPAEPTEISAPPSAVPSGAPDAPDAPDALMAGEASPAASTAADRADPELAEWWKRPGTLVIEPVPSGGATEGPTQAPAGQPGPQR